MTDVKRSEICKYDCFFASLKLLCHNAASKTQKKVNHSVKTIKNNQKTTGSKRKWGMDIFEGAQVI